MSQDINPTEIGLKGEQKLIYRRCLRKHHDLSHQVRDLGQSPQGTAVHEILSRAHCLKEDKQRPSAESPTEKHDICNQVQIGYKTQRRYTTRVFGMNVAAVRDEQANKIST